MYKSDNLPGARPSARASGFSMIELLVTLTIGAILMGLAAPSFNEQIARTRMTDASRDLADRLQIAMSASEARGPTTICASSDGLTCLATNTWTTGYIVFTDAGTVGTVDTGDVILERATALARGLSLITTYEIGNASYALGRVHFDQRAPDITGAVRFTVCQSTRTPHLVILNRIGSVRQTKGTTTCD